MRRRKQLVPLSAVAAGLLALSCGCATSDTNKSTSKKPDVLQPGVLPPPGETTNASAAPGGPVVPAGGVQAAPAAPVASPAASPLSSLQKLTQAPRKEGDCE